MKTDDISLHVLVRDEAATIGVLLDCLQNFVGEIVVIDTGSVDDTCEIAYHHTQKVYTIPLAMDFSRARNFGLSKATRPWIFHIDADEWPTQELLDWLKAWEPVSCVSGLRVCRHNLVGNEPIGKHTYEYLIRVFRRTSAWFIGRIHETPVFYDEGILVAAPMSALLLHHKSRERQRRQNAFYQQWEEQRAIVNYS